MLLLFFGEWVADIISALLNKQEVTLFPPLGQKGIKVF